MQNNSKPSHLSFTAQRTAGYLLGFALLYAPFELYRRFLENILNVQPAFLPHAFCPRIPTAEIFTGGFFELNNLMLVSTLLLAAVPAVWPVFLRQAVRGRLFCRKPQPSGAGTLAD